MATVSPSLLPVTALRDLDQAYRLLARRLERIVRFNVQGSDAMIEEACQFAWGRLLDHRGHVRAQSALPWLVKTAVREALRLQRRERRQLSLDAAIEHTSESPLGLDSGPEAVVERRERLSALAMLPERQQRLLWLQALGLSYVEIGRQTGDTPRTVERQLLRARRKLRATAA